MSNLNEPISPVDVDRRLDLIDQALLGVLPRQERLAWLAQAEARMREAAVHPASLSAAPLSGMAIAGPSAVVSENFPNSHAGSTLPASGWPLAASATANPVGPPRRSRLAIFSGLSGITAMCLLCGVPIIYLIVAYTSELLGEFLAVSILGVYIATVGVMGLLAVGLAIAAFFALRRRTSQLTGHGWAITGLCTGPLPVLACGLGALLLLAEMGIGVHSVHEIHTGNTGVVPGPPPVTPSGPIPYYPSPDIAVTGNQDRSQPMVAPQLLPHAAQSINNNDVPGTGSVRSLEVDPRPLPIPAAAPSAVPPTAAAPAAATPNSAVPVQAEPTNAAETVPGDPTPMPLASPGISASAEFISP
jgi:hypothetical protein